MLLRSRTLARGFGTVKTGRPPQRLRNCSAAYRPVALGAGGFPLVVDGPTAAALPTRQDPYTARTPRAYNLCACTRPTRVTPAMAANVTDQLRSIEELVEQTSK